MKDIQVRQILQELISHLREVGDMMEAVQVTIKEGVKIHKDFNNGIPIEEDDTNYNITKEVVGDAKMENMSMQDNTSFMLATIHKQIGKHKQVMKNFTED
ncbi:unnamed protein product [Lactuca virosa]|uniref:Uncharacterized protein n=1 Tax=Lactuca virosa TaxID=75947 RepID=A0AAU9NQA0_9ASTR|nr:unnamed protein product [Lactuca virosa]